MKKTLQLLSIPTICLPLMLFSQASIASTAEAFAACAKEEDSLKRLMCYDNASKASATAPSGKPQQVESNVSKSDSSSIEMKASETSATTIYEGQTPSNSVAVKSNDETVIIKNDTDVKPVVIYQGQTPSNSVISQSNRESTSKNEVAKVDDNVDAISQGQTPSNTAQSKKEITFNAEDSFGEEEKVVRQSLDEVTFSVTSASKNPYKQWVLTFSNGQVWGQKDDDQYIKFSTGDKVKIKRGLFGAFYLNDADGNRRIRVKRIK